MRGAISVAFLERIETIFAEHQRKLLTDYIAAKERAGIADEKLPAAKAKLAAPFMLADWFDLVGGTSTGSLIAGAIALGFNTADIKKFYLDRAPSSSSVRSGASPACRRSSMPARYSRRSTRSSRSARSTAKISSPGLSVVTKRMDTGSPWILTNNPRAPLLGHQAADAGRSGLSRQPALQAGDAGARQHRRAALLRSGDRADLAEEEKQEAPAAGPQDRDWLDQFNDSSAVFRD